jgi:large subunit ribosomal protein L1|uniref:Large ribosomal subunit protein uL1c n=1 Tax=Baffinella frigidus TaxID=2571260 RepID=A0A7T8JKA0_9CRYP|nr:ribosomal protein L1 [Cryptophyta sp. CCMP2293]
MAKISKRTRSIQAKLENKEYKGLAALKLLKEMATAKFVESAEAHISLKLDTKYADQQLRTTLVLPKGTGKNVRIAVVAEGEKQTEALAYGADLAGSVDLIQDIMKGMLDFDILIATPDMMPSIAKLGKILGPRGLMPSPKSGTVTTDVKGAIEEFKKGKLEYRADKSGIVHIAFGKTNFSVEDLLSNLESLQESIDKNRPSGVKGRYWKSFYICSTMGPSIQLDMNNFKDKLFSE